jgi:hypothetical protein
LGWADVHRLGGPGGGVLVLADHQQDGRDAVLAVEVGQVVGPTAGFRRVLLGLASTARRKLDSGPAVSKRMRVSTLRSTAAVSVRSVGRSVTAVGSLKGMPKDRNVRAEILGSAWRTRRIASSGTPCVDTPGFSPGRKRILGLKPRSG